ncbi:DEAD/DEAH box RNA helicase, partial [Phytophthora megakarya]
RLPTDLLANLSTNGFERPTPVQMQTVPCVLQGRNVLVSAPTGTSTTTSYLIPAIAQVLRAREDQNVKMVLVLVPVRELAIQIETVAKLLMRGIADMKAVLLAGGFPVPTQRYRLKSGVQLIVATPGRFLDIFTNYSEGYTALPAIHICVVDEVDMMLDVGFRPQISQRLWLYWWLALGSSRLNSNVKQQVRWSKNTTKKNVLIDFLTEKDEESTIMFTYRATMLAKAIEKCCGIGAASIHADKAQQERLILLEDFVNLDIPVLVSTNVLIRGMDLLSVDNVVVYDLPKNVADYVHLIDRTGRGDVSGTALTLVNAEDRSLFRDLIPLLSQSTVSVPREMYQSVHSEDTNKRVRSSEIVIDESKRAFRFRDQLVKEVDPQTSKLKEWDKQRSKQRKAES